MSLKQEKLRRVETAQAKPMGGDDPVAPPPLGEVIDAFKELAYHITGAGAPESHRARLYAAGLAFLQILHGDGQTLRYVASILRGVKFERRSRSRGMSRDASSGLFAWIVP